MPLIHFLDRYLFRSVSVLCQILILSSVAAAFYQVLARFVLQSPADWSEAWTRASLIWTVLLGIALAFRQGAMLSVEMLHGMLRSKNRRWLEHAIMIVCVAFLGFLAWVGGQMAWRVRFQTMPSFDISISWIYIAIPIGATLSVIAVLSRWHEGPPPVDVDDTAI